MRQRMLGRHPPKQTSAAPVMIPSPPPATVWIYIRDIHTAERGEGCTDAYFFSYPRAFAARLPAKLSVTSLHPGMLDENTPLSPEQANRYYLGIPEPCRSPESDKLSGSDEPPESENTLQTVADTATAPQTDTARSAAVQPAWNSAMHRPAFILSEKEKASSADIGTAVHVFLQFCDWNNVLENGIEAELARLTERGFITSDTAELVDRKKPLASSLLRCSRMRETPSEYGASSASTFCSPASDYTESAERRELLSDEQLLIQGIIDCMYISADGRLRLLDYKTDRVPRDTDKAAAMLAERYGGADAHIYACGGADNAYAARPLRYLCSLIGARDSAARGRSGHSACLAAAGAGQLTYSAKSKTFVRQHGRIYGTTQPTIRAVEHRAIRYYITAG